MTRKQYLLKATMVKTKRSNSVKAIGVLGVAGLVIALTANLCTYASLKSENNMYTNELTREFVQVKGLER